MIFRPIFLASACGLLAACGGGSSGSGGGAGGGDTFSDVLSDFRANPVLDEFESDATESVSFVELEAAGSATYTGQSLIYLVDDPENLVPVEDFEIESFADLPDPSLAGEVTLQTTFSGGEGAVEGTFDNFIDRDGNEKSGELVIVDGESGDFFGTAALGGTFEGSLSGAGLGSGDFEGELLGFFTPGGGIVGVGVDSLAEDEEDPTFALVFAAED